MCVYVWSNQQMRSWFWKHMFCFLLFRKDEDGTSTGSQEDLVRGANMGPGNSSSGGGHKAPRDEDDSDEEEGETGNEWLNDSLSTNAHLTEGRSTVSNPILHGGDEENRSGVHPREGNSMGSAGNQSRGSANSAGSKTKSILIAKGKNIDGKMKRNSAPQMAMSADLDNERYVRFGE